MRPEVSDLILEKKFESGQSLARRSFIVKSLRYKDESLDLLEM